MYTTNSDFIFNVNPNFIHRFWLLSGPIFNMNNNPVTLLHNYMNLKYPCLQYDNLKQFPFNLGTMLLVAYNLMYFYHQFVHEITIYWSRAPKYVQWQGILSRYCGVQMQLRVEFLRPPLPGLHYNCAATGVINRRDDLGSTSAISLVRSVTRQ